MRISKEIFIITYKAMDGYCYIAVVSCFCFVLVNRGRFVLALGETERKEKVQRRKSKIYPISV